MPRGHNGTRIRHTLKTPARPDGRGPLVVIGGREDRDGTCQILSEFLRLAGGPRAHILLIAVASINPAQVGADYMRIFKRLGAREVGLLDLSSREDASTPAALKAVKNATGVFFSGGNQVRITRFLGGTEMDHLLHRRHRAGLALAGTSAGAAMMSSIMIVGGNGNGSLSFRNVELGPGMEFFPGVVIDQHFQERWRFRRLLAAIARHPHDLGLGVDEDTAVVMQNRKFHVIGRGGVTVIDAKRLMYASHPAPETNDLLAVCGVTLHVLTEGMGYDLRSRTPITRWEGHDGTELATG